MTVEELIARIREGSTVDEVAEYLRTYGLAEIGLHRLDTHRERRSGSPEVVFGLGKSAGQVVEILRHCSESGRPILVTKVDETKAAAIRQAIPDATYDGTSRLLRLGTSESSVEGGIAIVTAGSSDQPIAEEAAGTLEFFGMKPVRVYDCGVAGLHRMLSQGSTLAAADLLIVVAGMEGALPSVVAGLFSQPVIGVPTSVGYGASFEGIAALLGMLNSCAAGITVVNIDNGFGAAIAARTMLRMAERRRMPGA